MRPCCAGCRGTIPLPTLTGEEVGVIEAKVRAMLDYVRSLGREQMFTPVEGENRWTVNRNGHAAEYAWCKFRGVEWSPLFVPGRTFTKIADAKDGGEIRQTKYASGSLVLHEPGIGKRHDNPAARFDLITGEVPDFTWRGWLVAADGQRPEFWRERSPRIPMAAFFVPQERLHGFPYHGPDQKPAPTLVVEPFDLGL